MKSLYSFLKNLSYQQLTYLLIGVTCLIYFNSLFGEFLSDDRKQILDNAIIHSLSNFFIFFQGSTFDSGTGVLVGLFYRPLQTIYFSVLWTIFGDHPFFFHFFQLVFHTINGLLVFFIFRHCFSKTLAFFLSLIFLVHPMNVETVSYISSSGIVISILFGLLAFKLVLRENGGIKEYALVSAFLSLSVLSHETGSLFIPLILVFKFLYDRRHLLPYLGSTILALAIYALFRFGVGHIYFPHILQSPMMTLPLSERLLSLPKILFFYVSTFLFPAHLSFSQIWVVSNRTIADFYAPIAILLAITLGLGIFAYRLYKTNTSGARLFAFFTAWLLIGLVLFIQIIPAEQTVTERWFYFATVGLLGLIGVLIEHFFSRKSATTKAWLIVLALIIIALLSTRSIIRNHDWKDEFTLATHDMRRDPNNYILANTLGTEYLRRGDTKTAIGLLEKSSAEFVDAQTLSNLGAAYLLAGDNDRSKEALQKSIGVNETSEAVINMAWLLATKGNPTEGEAFIESRIEKYQSLWKMWMDLAIVKYKLGKNEEALRAAQKAYTMSQNGQTVYLYNQISKGLPLKVD